jgi:hypothetical protein
MIPIMNPALPKDSLRFLEPNMTDNKAGIKPIKIIGINPKGEE